MENDVKTIKLVTHEELVGKVTEIQLKNGKKYTIKNPALIHVQPDPSGRPQLGLVMALPLVDNAQNHQLEIKEEHVVYTYVPNSTVVKAYHEQFSTIIPASSLSSIAT